MQCEEAEALIEAYADRELAAAQVVAITKHLATCEGCQQRYRAVIDLRNSLQQHCQVETPSVLRRRIETDLRRKPARRFIQAIAQHVMTRGVPLTLAILLGIFIGFQSRTFIPGNNETIQLQDSIVSAHIDSLLVDHMTDVPSGDTHTVKPWFAGRLDFSPPVFQFEEEGFYLSGGRLEYIQDRITAALVYRRRKHIINLFVWPAKGQQAISQSSIKGYNLVKWRVNGLQYYLVSDLNRRELYHFGALYYTRCKAQAGGS